MCSLTSYSAKTQHLSSCTLWFFYVSYFQFFLLRMSINLCCFSPHFFFISHFGLTQQWLASDIQIKFYAHTLALFFLLVYDAIPFFLLFSLMKRRREREKLENKLDECKERVSSNQKFATTINNKLGSAWKRISILSLFVCAENFFNNLLCAVLLSAKAVELGMCDCINAVLWKWKVPFYLPCMCRFHHGMRKSVSNFFLFFRFVSFYGTNRLLLTVISKQKVYKVKAIIKCKFTFWVSAPDLDLLTVRKVKFSVETFFGLKRRFLLKSEDHFV